MSETRYTLTVTEDQACAISAACELLARLGMGQLDDALRFDVSLGPLRAARLGLSSQALKLARRVKE